MSMTEDEAKTKWCPFMAQAQDFSRASHRQKCIASECMAWRWARVDAIDGGDGYSLSQTHGNCGLARHP